MTRKYKLREYLFLPVIVLLFPIMFIVLVFAFFNELIERNEKMILRKEGGTL